MQTDTLTMPAFLTLLEVEPASVAEAVACRVARELPQYPFAATKHLRTIITAELSVAQRHTRLKSRIVQPNRFVARLFRVEEVVL